MPAVIQRLVERYRRPEDEDTKVCLVLHAKEIEEIRKRQADLARRLAVAEAQARVVRAAQVMGAGGRHAD